MMSDLQINDFINDIKRKTGIDMKVRSRKRKYFYSKVVFFQILKKENPEMILTKMGDFVGMHHTTVVYSLKNHRYLKEYPDFKAIEDTIMEIRTNRKANPMIYCNHTTYKNE